MMEFVIILSALCITGTIIYLANIFNRTFKEIETTLHTMERNVSSLCDRAIPVLENMEAITTKVRNITDNLDDQLSIVRDSVDSFRRSVDEVVDFKRRLQNRIEEPMMSSVSFVSSIVKGIQVFFEKMRS